MKQHAGKLFLPASDGPSRFCRYEQRHENLNSTPQKESVDYGTWVKNVWGVVAGIPSGHVLTYGEVARLSGNRRAARRVSQAMGRAPKKMKLPWHRVVNVQGKLSFPADSQAYQRQKTLLEKEGVIFVKEKIDLQRFGYEGALDQLLWGEPL